MEKEQQNLLVDVGVMKSEIQNIKQTAEETKVQNTAEHLEIKTSLKDISRKIDSAIEGKADKDDVKDLRDKGWGIIMAIIVVFLGLVATAIKSFTGKL